MQGRVAEQRGQLAWLVCQVCRICQGVRDSPRQEVMNRRGFARGPDGRPAYSSASPTMWTERGTNAKREAATSKALCGGVENGLADAFVIQLVGRRCSVPRGDQGCELRRVAGVVLAK